MKGRKKKDPAVAAFDEGCTRGLPVQSLYPFQEWTAAGVADADAAPFVAAPVKDIVFCNPDVVLASAPHVSDTNVVLDSLKFVTQSYVGGVH